MNQDKMQAYENPEIKDQQSPIEYQIVNARPELQSFQAPLPLDDQFRNSCFQWAGLEKHGVLIKKSICCQGFYITINPIIGKLIIAFFLGIIAYHRPSFFNVIINYKGVFLWGALVLAAGTLIAIFFYQKLARRVPFNYMAFFLFTFFASFFLISICCIIIDYFGSDGAFVVFTSALMSIVLTIALGIYALFSKNQFSYKGGVITAIISIVIVFLIVCWLNLDMILFVLLSIIGVLLYGLFLVYDIQNIINGERYDLTVDDYIIAPLLFYIDIVYMFLKLMYCVVICLFCCINK